MKYKLIVLALLALPYMAQAQLGGLLKKVKQKAEAATEQKAEELLKGKSGANTQKEETAAANTSKAVTDLVIAYSKFDFVPGDKIIYAEDFGQDEIGEFPLLWKTKGKGEIVKLEGHPGKWLHGYKEGTITSVNKNELGDNYTVEFDLIYHFGAKAAVYVMPDLTVRLLNNYTVDYKNATGNVSERDGERSFQFTVHPKDDASLAWVETYGVRPEFTSEKVQVSSFSGWYNQPVHYAIQVQNNRLRVWMNEKKVFDLPQAITVGPKTARIAFQLGHTSFDEDQVGYYVTNIRMATGSPDTRHKLLESGSFSTTGILFEVNSDNIRPESSGVLNELAKILKENPTVRIRITGHTSSDGTAAANLDLSKKRAIAIKEHLSKAGIDATRLETAGLGDTKPVAANNTKEGRSQNRRVEFTKL